MPACQQAEAYLLSMLLLQAPHNHSEALRGDSRRPLLDPSVAEGGEAALRPARLQDFVGQRGVCENLQVFVEAARGRGVGRALIDAVYSAARAAKASRVYWQTYETNTTARLLYDKMAKHHGSIVYSQEL